MSSRDNGQGQGRFLNACWVLRGGREKNDALAAHNSLLPPTHGQSKNPPTTLPFPEGKGRSGTKMGLTNSALGGMGEKRREERSFLPAGVDEEGEGSKEIFAGYFRRCAG